MQVAASQPPCVVLARGRHPLPHAVVETLLRCVRRARLDTLDPAAVAAIDDAERALVELTAGGVGDGRTRPDRSLGRLPENAEA